MLKSFRLRNLILKRKMTSLAQIDTPTMPKVKHSILRQTISPKLENTATMTPTPSSPINIKSNHILISIALPPKDQGLEYIATKAIITVTSTISTINPHSKVLLL